MDATWVICCLLAELMNLHTVFCVSFWSIRLARLVRRDFAKESNPPEAWFAESPSMFPKAPIALSVVLSPPFSSEALLSPSRDINGEAEEENGDLPSIPDSAAAAGPNKRLLASSWQRLF
eukprot:CAMPEP_0195534672 /NCGR_PEP_ID=MMETSP0794_2-20130614/42819_1 /TAXON_ID=515487 /ORGANISM="Stephanopyxis turris, Strain CCMP 815" /LENGTH=119 /DNA_ID=CAMNT_0040667581 /DNA_START=753 /DNA_END=1112 /DNA_ORIENTATION=-